MRKKKIPISPSPETKSVDPSRIPVEIDGRAYDLCFEFTELAKAERLFRSQGHKLNLLVALPELSLESIREVFPCAAHKHHPDLTFGQAQALITLESAYPVAAAIVQAWNEASSKNAIEPPAEGEGIWKSRDASR
jgi:hypothetical protein